MECSRCIIRKTLAWGGTETRSRNKPTESEKLSPGKGNMEGFLLGMVMMESFKVIQSIRWGCVQVHRRKTMLLGILLLGVEEGAHRHQPRGELEKPVVGIRVTALGRVTRSKRAIITLAAVSTLSASDLAFQCHSPQERARVPRKKND